MDDNARDGNVNSVQASRLRGMTEVTGVTPPEAGCSAAGWNTPADAFPRSGSTAPAAQTPATYGRWRDKTPEGVVCAAKERNPCAAMALQALLRGP
jgi:hypothetical protein